MSLCGHLFCILSAVCVCVCVCVFLVLLAVVFSVTDNDFSASIPVGVVYELLTHLVCTCGWYKPNTFSTIL